MYLCLMVFFLLGTSAYALPFWVENNCTLERNTSTFMADKDPDCKKKIRYWKSDSTPEDEHWDTNSGEEHSQHVSDSQHLDAALLTAQSRRFWLILLKQAGLFQYCSHYQSIDGVLISPPPQLD